MKLPFLARKDLPSSRQMTEPNRLSLLFPDSIQGEQMNYLINWARDCNIMYFETPKVACTTVKRLLQTAEVKGDTSKLLSNAHDKHLSPLASPYDDIDAFEKAYHSRNCLKVTFVRNPYTRALSCYKEKILRAVSDRSRRALLGLPDEGEITFLQFLQAVAVQPLAEMDIHWAPQYNLTMPGTVPYDMIGRLEHMGLYLEQLASFAGLPAENLGNYRAGGHFTGANRLIHDFYCLESKAIVDEIYARDFESFGYPKSLKLL